MTDVAISLLKLLIFVGIYLIRQRLCKKRIRPEHIAITLILALYTKPVIEDALFKALYITAMNDRVLQLLG
jgi:hypothetical protein